MVIALLILRLLLAAGFVAWFGHDHAGLSALSWIGVLTVAQCLELLGFLIVLALLLGSGWLLWQILRQQGRLLLRLEATEARLAEAGLAPLGDQAGESVAVLAMGAQTPGFRLPDLDGTTGSPLAQGADAIPDLVEAAMDQLMRRTMPMVAAASHNNGTGATAVPGQPANPRIGDAAPDFSLPDLSGNLVQLSDFRGRQTLVLFWRPGCGFCQRMLPHLLAWETQPPEGAPRLLVVSTGSVQDNQAMGLRSPVVLDRADRSIGSMFGATGTPTAVLVDAEGKIASELAAGAPAILALATTQPTKAEGSIELTIGMATYNDFDGVYFTLQALRLYQDLENTELLVIDNYGCQETKNLVEGWLNGRYILAKDAVGTAAPRDLIFREARGKAVLCCDCHVLFPPGVIAQLKQFYREHPDCHDLLQGPLLYDDGKLISTHFDPVWRDQMWGTWGSDPRGQDPSGEPFEIPMQGLGVFSCLKRAWLGFHPEFRGFGGEEGYIHEKFRQAGRQCLCLPWLRWMHRFSRPSGVKYPLIVEDKLRNYVIGHAELGLDLVPVLRHFSAYLSQDRVIAIAEQALAGQWAGGSAAFLNKYGTQLQVAGLPEEF